MYEILFSRSAEKDLEKLPKSVIKRTSQAIDELAENPRPPGCKKLKGSDDNLWRIRVGDYRIVYAVNDTILIVDIRRIAHRKNVYE